MNQNRPPGTSQPPTGSGSSASRPLDLSNVGSSSDTVPSLRPDSSKLEGGSSGAPLTASDTARRTIRVEHGDTLAAIARRVYGHPSRWPLIFDANRDRLDDPELIYPGLILLLPDAPPDA
ncbi:LysM peptidoglycan-binding domain-containing protein [Lysobacter korlensis]|uniref:LysM peptidoglycan-binding domain-containing protein n=1 Tax=Lysobacter korlensis TaxID=553636 RepID=A0ABV6RHX7_9GAMM